MGSGAYHRIVPTSHAPPVGERGMLPVARSPPRIAVGIGHGGGDQSLTVGSMYPPQIQGEVQSAVSLAVAGRYLLQAAAAVIEA